MRRTAAILHTTAATIGGFQKILAETAPWLTVRNYLDESLLPQINREGRISDSAAYRFLSLANSAALAGPDAMLCACSSVGELVESARPMLAAPFLRVDEPMAAAVAKRGGKAIVCATLPSTLGPTRRLIEREAVRQGTDLRLHDLLIEEAGPLLTAGDLAAYDALLASHFTRLAEEADVFVLAQASMARAIEGLPEALKAKFITSPKSGLLALVDRIKKDTAERNES